MESDRKTNREWERKGRETRGKGVIGMMGWEKEMRKVGKRRENVSIGRKCWRVGKEREKRRGPIHWFSVPSCRRFSGGYRIPEQYTRLPLTSRRSCHILSWRRANFGPRSFCRSPLLPPTSSFNSTFSPCLSFVKLSNFRSKTIVHKLFSPLIILHWIGMFEKLIKPTFVF